MSKRNSSTKKIVKELSHNDNILMALHLSPDTDSAASCLALAHYLNTLKKKATIVSTHKIPAYISNILDITTVKQHTDPAELDLNKYSLFIGLDSDNPSRFSEDENLNIKKSLKTICIDHHKTNKYWGDLNFITTKYVSTCSTLYYIFKKEGIEINQKLGEILMVGLLSDSGIFNYEGTSSFDLRMAADLMEKGVKMHKIIWNMTFNKSLDDMKMKSITYENLIVNYDKKYAYTTISIEDKKNHDIDPNRKFPPVSDDIKQLRGVNFVFALAEKPEGYYTLSFRSHNPKFDVSKIALLFNGGGHNNSSGGIIKNKEDLEEALEYTINTIDKYLYSQEIHN